VDYLLKNNYLSRMCWTNTYAWKVEKFML